MIARIGILLALLIGLLIISEVRAQSVAAQAPGLTVQVVNGTTADKPVSGLPLEVYQITADQQQAVGQGQTAADGRFAWPALSGPVSARFVVSTTYQGVAYHTEPTTLPAPAIPLRVYEAGADDAAVHIASAGLVLLHVDATTQRIQVLETMVLDNKGSRTFLPSTTGPRGPMGLLRFGLPATAGNLVLNGRLQASTIIQVNTGFATDMPVPPGATEVSYTYEVAYGDLTGSGYATLNQSLPYAADLFRVLAPPAEYSLSSAQLVAAGTVTIGSQTYRVFQGQSLPPHTEVDLELRNLPLNPPILRSSNPWLQGIVAILLFAAIGVPLLYSRWYARQIRIPGAGGKPIALAPDRSSVEMGATPPEIEP